MKAWVKAITRFNDFQGRSSRKELWMFILYNNIISLLLAVIDIIIQRIFFNWDNYLSTSFLILTLLPLIAMNTRRLHDLEKSGWFFLVPIYGPLICLFKKGDISANKYGQPTDSIESGKNDIRR